MDLKFDASLADFRTMIRDAIKQDLPREIQERTRLFGGANSSDPHDSLAWMKILSKRGWTVPHWPEIYGGKNWSPLQLFIFQEELYKAYAPDTCWGGTHMVGPIIYTFGSEAQKEQFLPAIRNGDYYWAQGFSEPGSGSDLASLRTAAVRKGDKYIVNGQKIWTSCAYMSEWGFFLVRTDPEVKPQRGISFLLINMKSPGITIRRIPQINEEAELCEVFLDDVEVPAEQLVGEEGQGWSYAKFLLDHERTTSSFIYFNKRELDRAKMIATEETLDGVPLILHPNFQGRIARLEAEISALEGSVMRLLANEEFKYNETAVASILKVSGSKLQQALTELHVDLIGPKAIRHYASESVDRDPYDPWPDHIPGRTSQALILRASTIYGGSLQVQKNIIAKLAFGL